ncbi:helicase associated domain-containing protein [Photobacterium sp. BZF1]|uniref:helicase associated domain-containing protein n=1 Tax=Photobacterium sp. BZF1 TaxID=1904457 RepID=UPI0016535D71|nr:helicase associated domain-containing protein [Photobacterium sp. BZF1]
MASTVGIDTIDRWFYDGLKEFLLEGHSVPFGREARHFKTQSGFKLGLWVNHIRLMKKTNLLRDEHIAILDEVNFIFDKDSYQWELGLRAYREYTKQHGLAIVPKGYMSSEHFPLGNWLAKARNEYSRNKLSQTKSKSLFLINSNWFKEIMTLSWQDSYRQLLRFREIRGHLNVWSSYETKDGFRLGKWVFEQRELQRRAMLPEVHYKALNDIGFNWQDSFNHIIKQGAAFQKIELPAPLAKPVVPKRFELEDKMVSYFAKSKLGSKATIEYP